MTTPRPPVAAPLAVRAVATPVGALTVAASAAGVRAVLWGRDDAPAASAEIGAAGERAAAWLERALRELDEYFRGERRRFDVPLDLRGSPFQRLVWDALTDIPHGETRTYGAVAARIGRPAAARAVGAATGRNPAPVIVPCHRVVGANGALTGFAGGIATKRALLALETGAADGGRLL